MRDPSKIGPARAAALGPAPQHGCYLARYHAGPDIEDGYRHTFVGLEVPAAMADASAGHNATVVYMTYASNPDTLRGFGDAPPIMRKAVCRIPQTEAARVVLAEQLGIAIPAASGAEAEAAARALPAPPSELASGVLPGNWENEDGFVCPMGYNWDSIDMTTCVNSFGALSLPVVHVSVDEPDRGDDGAGGEPGDLEGYWPDEDGEVYTPTECLQEDETLPGGSGNALCVPTGGNSPLDQEEEAGWGKAIKIGRKIKDAVDRGDDLLDVQTWKRIGQEEWDDLLECGLNTMDATTGDPVAIVSALDCAADQLLGFSFFELLSGLKIADRLGLGWYDDVMGAMTDAMRGIDDLGSLHSLLKSATDTGLDASRTATQRFPGVFDNVKDAFDIADSQLQSKFKHASDFGVDGNWNSTNRERFRNALNQHIQNSETVVGTYRGNPVYHHYDQSSGLNVIQRPNGEFLSGWRLNPDQAANVENRGSL